MLADLETVNYFIYLPRLIYKFSDERGFETKIKRRICTTKDAMSKHQKIRSDRGTTKTTKMRPRNVMVLEKNAQDYLDNRLLIIVCPRA